MNNKIFVTFVGLLLLLFLSFVFALKIWGATEAGPQAFSGLIDLLTSLLATVISTIFVSSRLMSTSTIATATAAAGQQSVLHTEAKPIKGVKLKALFRLIAAFLIALLFISLFANGVLYTVARLETAHLFFFDNQGYREMQFYIYGTLFLMVVPVITTASVALANARESDAVSYWLFFLSTIIASALWIGGNLTLSSSGFGDVDQFRRATGFSGGSTGLVLAMQTLVALGICAIVALYESLIWRSAMYFARLGKRKTNATL